MSNGKYNDKELYGKLGSGNQGIVFKIKLGKDFFAYKIGYEQKRNRSKKDSQLLTEQKFSNTMQKYPFFMKLIDTNIINDISKFDFSNIVSKYPDTESFFSRYDSNYYCIEKIYSLIDENLKDIIYDLDCKTQISIFLQVGKAIKLMNKHKFYHNDLRIIDNVGVIRTSEKEIYVDKEKIPTNGYIIQLIDYDRVMYIPREKKLSFQFLYQWEKEFQIFYIAFLFGSLKMDDKSFFKDKYKKSIISLLYDKINKYSKGLEKNDDFDNIKHINLNTDSYYDLLNGTIIMLYRYLYPQKSSLLLLDPKDKDEYDSIYHDLEPIYKTPFRSMDHIKFIYNMTMEEMMAYLWDKYESVPPESGKCSIVF